jgi:hypothetical protein
MRLRWHVIVSFASSLLNLNFSLFRGIEKRLPFGTFLR